MEMLKYKSHHAKPRPWFLAATSRSGGLSSACRPASTFNNPPTPPPITPTTTLLPSLSTAPSSLYSLSPPLIPPIPPPDLTPHDPPMATIISSSSPDDHIPTATLALPSIAAASAPRRLPPPCWTPEETVALIDAYKDKWYSLRRGNLRSDHWKEVASDVAARCPVNPAKTEVQCRHKMEKLRKRYRSEIQRSAAHGRSASSWAHFQQMQSMEKGTDNPTPPSTSSDEEEEDNKTSSVKRINDLYNRHTNQNGSFPNQSLESAHNGITPGVRIKMPGGGAATAKLYGHNSNSNPNPNPNPRSIPNSMKAGIVGKRKESGDGSRAMVSAIQALGEGFMRMEKMKMDMAQQIEEMRMEAELKRTQMILESQQRIVESFAHAIKKPRKNHDYV